MFKLSKKNRRYLYLEPLNGDAAKKWEVLEQDEVDKRVQGNLFKEGARLFLIEKEFEISFETTTHIR